MRKLLHYETYVNHPSSEWVVFIHGAGGSSKTWSRQLPAFQASYNLLIMDLRDHGKSKLILPTAAAYSFQLISEDIKSVLDHVGITSAYFISLSFGSVLIQDFSQRFPGLIKKAVLVGAIFNGGPTIRAFVYLARFFNIFLPYSMMYGLFSYLLMPKKRNQVARKLYQSQAKKISPKEYMKWVGLYREFFQLLERFAKEEIPFPAIVIMGADDYVFLKSAMRFTSHQPLVSMETIPNTGHIANIENADAFNRVALDFLQKKQVQTPRTKAVFGTSSS